MHRILVVDDEVPIQDLLVRMLSADGHEVGTAGSAEEALTAMEAQPAEVVFCDVNMPGQNGLWLAHELHDRYPATAVVLSTGVPDIPPASSMQAGITGYLVKPFTPEECRYALAAAMFWHAKTEEFGEQPAPHTQTVDDWFDQLP